MEGRRQNGGKFPAVQFGAFAFPRFASLLALLATKLPLLFFLGKRGRRVCRGGTTALGEHVDVQRSVNSI